MTFSSSTMRSFFGGAILCAACAGCGGGGQGPSPAEPEVSPADAQPAPPPPAEADAGEAAAPVEVAIGAADAGRQIELPLGQTLVLSLESNVSTGYSWAVTRIDEAVLRQAGDPSYQEGGAAGVVGAPGTQIFRFQPVAPGTTELELGYRRPWETGVAPVRTFAARIVVR